LPCSTKPRHDDACPPGASVCVCSRRSASTPLAWMAPAESQHAGPPWPPLLKERRPTDAAPPILQEALKVLPLIGALAYGSERRWALGGDAPRPPKHLETAAVQTRVWDLPILTCYFRECERPRLYDFYMGPSCLVLHAATHTATVTLRVYASAPSRVLRPPPWAGSQWKLVLATQEAPVQASDVYQPRLFAA
jgi:hypothetical protein